VAYAEAFGLQDDHWRFPGGVSLLPERIAPKIMYLSTPRQCELKSPGGVALVIAISSA
jgi:hypothetical protein